MASLKDCAQIEKPKDRMDCIEKNMVLVNSSLESVADELRKKVQKILDTISDDVIERLVDLEKNALKRGDVVTISSVDPTRNEDRHNVSLGLTTWHLQERRRVAVAQFTPRVGN